MKVLLLFFAYLFLAKAQGHAQLIKVLESDSLNIYTNKDGEDIKPACCELRFVSEIDDSVKVLVNNKLLFSKFIRTDSTVLSTRVDQTAPAVKFSMEPKRLLLIISFLNEKISIKSDIIKGYKYLYVY